MNKQFEMVWTVQPQTEIKSRMTFTRLYKTFTRLNKATQLILFPSEITGVHQRSQTTILEHNFVNLKPVHEDYPILSHL